jgi:hypothetical protein
MHGRAVGDGAGPSCFSMPPIGSPGRPSRIANGRPALSRSRNGNLTDPDRRIVARPADAVVTSSDHGEGETADLLPHMPQVGPRLEDMVFISGIGCAAGFLCYMNRVAATSSAMGAQIETAIAPKGLGDPPSLLARERQGAGSSGSPDRIGSHRRRTQRRPDRGQRALTRIRGADRAICGRETRAARCAGTQPSGGTDMDHIKEPKTVLDDRPCAEPSCRHLRTAHGDGTGTGPEAGTGCRLCDCWIYTSRSRLFGRRVFWATIGMVGRGWAAAAAPPR